MDWLSDEELVALTHLTQGAAQRRALQSWGIFFVVRPDGTPLVHRKAVERVLGGVAANDRTAGNGLRWSTQT